MKKYTAEFIGTFALVFCGTGAIVINETSNGKVTHIGIAISFGLIVMAMIYALGEKSGAHLNPAVSIAFTVNGNFPARQLVPYILSQLAGAFFASIILKWMFPGTESLGATLPSGSNLQSFVLELILAFFLMLVIINVSAGTKEQGLFAGLAIGSVVLLEAMFAGPVSGASMNPARSIAPAVVSGQLTALWIYIAAPVLGAIAAVFVQKLLE